MPDTPEGLQAQIDASERVTATLTSLAQILARDRSRERRAKFVTIVAAVVAALALGGLWAGQNSIQEQQADFKKVQATSAARGKRIERSVNDTHQTNVILTCALVVGRMNLPEAQQQSELDRCVKADGKYPGIP